MARWTASAKWGEAPALDGQRDMPLALRLSEGLGRRVAKRTQDCIDPGLVASALRLKPLENVLIYPQGNE